MKDLFIIPECYIDTNLVETLIITDGCNHQKGCNTVVKTMQQKFANAFSVGIIALIPQHFDLTLFISS